MRARCEVGQNDGTEWGVRVKVARLGDPLGSLLFGLKLAV